MFPIRIGLALIATLLVPVSTSYAATESVANNVSVSDVKTKTLTLRDAITATLARNPQLNSFQFRTQMLDGERQTAALTPALRLSTDLENIAGSGSFKGTDSAELTLALSSVIELGDKRDARLGLVTERQQQLAAERDIIELDLLAEVTRRFIDVAAAQQQVALQESTFTLAKETTSAIKRRVDVGNTPDAELARAQANEARAAIGVHRAKLGLNTAKTQLSALWAVTEPDFDSVSADLLSPGEARPLNDLLSGIANNPDIAFFASEARLRDAEMRLALAKSKMDVEWNAGVRRLEATKDSALVVGVSVPLFAGNRGAGELASAKANRQRVESDRDTALLQLRARVIGLYQERDSALYEVESLRTNVIPQLKKAVNSTRDAFDKGRYGYMELHAAQNELLEAETALIAAASNAHLLRVEIERLSGSTTTNNTHTENTSEVNP